MILPTQITEIWTLPFFYRKDVLILELERMEFKKHFIEVMLIDFGEDQYYVQVPKRMEGELAVGNRLQISKEPTNRGARIEILYVYPEEIPLARG